MHRNNSLGVMNLIFLEMRIQTAALWIIRTTELCLCVSLQHRHGIYSHFIGRCVLSTVFMLFLSFCFNLKNFLSWFTQGRSSDEELPRPLFVFCKSFARYCILNWKVFIWSFSFYFTTLNTASTVAQPTFLLDHPLVIFVGSTVHKSFYYFKNYLLDFLEFDYKTFCWCFWILLREPLGFIGLGVCFLLQT